MTTPAAVETGDDAARETLRPVDGLKRVRARLGLATAGLMAFGATQLVAAMTARSALASGLLQAVTAELSAGKLGVTWSASNEPTMTATEAAKRAGRGALASLVAVALGLGLGRLVGQLSLAPAAPSVSMLVVGAVGPLCLAARDELLLRGFVFSVLDGLAPRVVITVVAALASVAVASAAPGATPADLAAAGLVGLVCASFWARERGLWSALGCHATHGYMTSVVLSGGLLDVRAAAAHGARFGLGSAFDTSTAGLFALAAVALVTLAWSRIPQPVAGRAGAALAR